MAQALPKSPYKYVVVPAGWRRALPTEITPTVQKAASVALRSCLPVGKMQTTNINGRLFMFVTEGHYDDHVTGPGKPIWHPGISTYVAKVEPVIDANSVQRLAAASFIDSSRQGTAITGEGMDEQELHNPVYGGDFGDDIGASLNFSASAGGSVAAKAKAAAALKAKAAAALKAKAAASARAKAAVKSGTPKKVQLQMGYPVGKPPPKPVAKPVAPRPAVPRPAAPSRGSNPSAYLAPAVAATTAAAVAAPVTNSPGIFSKLFGPKTPETKNDSPLGPQAPFGTRRGRPSRAPRRNPSFAQPTYAQPAIQQAAFDDSVDAEAFDAAMADYEDPSEETPETADEGSESYDPTAIGAEIFG